MDCILNKSVYDNDSVMCDVCKFNKLEKGHFYWHCKNCSYDLCDKCASNNPSNTPSKNDANCNNIEEDINTNLKTKVEEDMNINNFQKTKSNNFNNDKNKSSKIDEKILTLFGKKESDSFFTQCQMYKMPVTIAPSNFDFNDNKIFETVFSKSEISEEENSEKISDLEISEISKTASITNEKITVLIKFSPKHEDLFIKNAAKKLGINKNMIKLRLFKNGMTAVDIKNSDLDVTEKMCNTLIKIAAKRKFAEDVKKCTDVEITKICNVFNTVLFLI
ncbi:hypothetical protein MHBO_000296 [Bonamia ostreae]|uniref:ZZ-type domain-containing protein n=1 Tax=Bonamia ostreae TaxID=126728 RepID=A0ABV2AFS0_9EUKA